MLKYIDIFFLYLDVTAGLVAFFFVTLLFIKRKFCFTERVSAIFIITQAILNVIANTLMEYSISNHSIYLLNALCTQVIFGYYFYNLFKSYFKFTFLIKWLVIVFVFIVFYLIFITNDKINYTTYSLSVNAFLIVVYCLISFWKLVFKENNLAIYNTKQFYLLAALLVYFGSSFVIFLSHNYLAIIIPKQVWIIWRVHNLFFGIAFFFFVRLFFITNEYPNNFSTNSNHIRI